MKYRFEENMEEKIEKGKIKERVKRAYRHSSHQSIADALYGKKYL